MKDSSLETSEGLWPCQHLDFGLQAIKTIKSLNQFWHIVAAQESNRCSNRDRSKVFRKIKSNQTLSGASVVCQRGCGDLEHRMMMNHASTLMKKHKNQNTWHSYALFQQLGLYKCFMHQTSKASTRTTFHKMAM